jgi:hypothetical protein
MLERLKQEFLISDDVVKVKLEQLLTKALPFCGVDPKGRVHFKFDEIGSKNRVGLALVARRLVSELDHIFVDTLSIAGLVESTGLDEKQVRARLSELVRERVAESPSRGEYRASPHRMEKFLDALGQKRKS